MATPTNYSACVRIPLLNFSWDKIFVDNVQPAKIFNLENFRLYGILKDNVKKKKKKKTPQFAISFYNTEKHNDIVSGN